MLTDPELVAHIGQLLQAYREAAPDRREEALLAAMRQIRSSSLAGRTNPPRPAQAAPATSSPVQASPGVRTVSRPAAEVQTQSSAMAAGTAPAPAQREVPSSIQPPFTPDWFTPSLGQDRRTYPRLRCFIAVELRSECWEGPAWGNLANVSAGGCFIETVQPVSKSTKLEIGLWANNGKVWVKGIVINGIVTDNKPTLGLRLQYQNMGADERETLRFFLKFVEDTTKNYEQQNGYLAQLKK